MLYSFTSDCRSKAVQSVAGGLNVGVSELIRSKAEQHTVSQLVHDRALWSSPWELWPSSLGELSLQCTSIQRKLLCDWGDLIKPVSCRECSTVNLLTSLSSFLSQPLPEIFITATYQPLINYTPAIGLEWIINILLISISPIDFCHSFEMHRLDGVFFSSFSWHLSNQQWEPMWADISRVNSTTLEKEGRQYKSIFYIYEFFFTINIFIWCLCIHLPCSYSQNL